MFYILYGADELALRETLAAMRSRLAEEDPAPELNDTTLDGRSLDLPGLRSAADSLPFLGPRRLVVVHGMLARCQGRAADAKALAEALQAYLPNVPPTTRLVFVEGALEAKNPVLKWSERWRGEAESPDESVILRRFDPPKPAQVPAWLERRAAQRGGAIAPDAARSLADALQSEGEIDISRADSELEKLLVYADGRAVSRQDVELLVTAVSLERVFTVLDALSERRQAVATAQLHRFLDEGEPPLRLLALIGRQFRLLAMTRALLDEGTPASRLGEHLKVPPFAVAKLARQARAYTSEELVDCLRELLSSDAAIKKGRMDPAVAIDLFVASVCRPTSAQTGR